MYMHVARLNSHFSLLHPYSFFSPPYLELAICLTLGKWRSKCLSLCSCASLWAVSTVIFYKSLLFTSNSSPFIKLPHHLQAALPCSESSTLFSRLFCSWLGQCPFPPLMKNWAFCCPHQLTLPLQGHQMPLPALSPFPELQGLSSTSDKEVQPLPLNASAPWGPADLRAVSYCTKVVPSTEALKTCLLQPGMSLYPQPTSFLQGLCLETHEFLKMLFKTSCSLLVNC